MGGLVYMPFPVGKHDLYLDLAIAISKHSTCLRLKVGCVLVNDGRVLSLGYNGAPRGEPHCTEVGCDLVKVGERVSCKRSVHAEANALVNAAYVGAATKGSLLYTTWSPCYDCAKLLINAGVEGIIYLNTYTSPSTWQLWKVVSEGGGRSYARKRPKIAADR